MPALPSHALMRSAVLGASLLAGLAACAEAPLQPSADEPVATITFTQTTDTVLRGAVDTVLVSLMDGRQRALAGRTVTWSSSDTTIAIVTSDTSTSAWSGRAGVVVRARALGTVQISARIDSLVATTTVVIRPVPVRAIDLTMVPNVPYVGDTATLRLVMRDSINQLLDARPATFSVSPAGVVAVSAAGHVTALAMGQAVITATVEGVRDSLPVSVLGEQVAVLTLDPRELLLGPGVALPVRAWLKDARDVQITARPVTYQSSNPAVATIDARGVITTIGPGVAQITAVAGMGADTIPVTVVAPTPSHFPLEIIFTGTANPALEAVFVQAAARWTRVITGALPPASVTMNAGQCGTGTPAITITQHAGLTIFARIDSVDGPGKIIGHAGPCVLRSSADGRLPLLGVMTFDRDDLAGMLDRGTALGVVLHEMGHVLGIGTLWNFVQPHVPAVDSGMPRYHIGPSSARSAYDLGFAETPTIGAPVETDGGGGTAGAHWDEALLQMELMTGWIGGAKSPLSALTIAAFRDMGYVVDPAGADGFSVASTWLPGWPQPIVPVLGGSGTLIPADDQRTRIEDRVVRPWWTVDRRGRVTPLPDLATP